MIAIISVWVHHSRESISGIAWTVRAGNIRANADQIAKNTPCSPDTVPDGTTHRLRMAAHRPDPSAPSEFWLSSRLPTTLWLSRCQQGSDITVERAQWQPKIQGVLHSLTRVGTSNHLDVVGHEADEVDREVGVDEAEAELLGDHRGLIPASRITHTHASSQRTHEPRLKTDQTSETRDRDFNSNTTVLLQVLHVKLTRTRSASSPTRRAA
eukprot:2816675-Rhodomonas_salina.2